MTYINITLGNNNKNQVCQKIDNELLTKHTKIEYILLLI